MNLSHIALLVNSVDSSAAFLSSQGFQCGVAEVFESEGTKEIYVGDYQDQSGLLLLLEAIGEGPYKRAFNKRGASLHHISFDVLDLPDFLNQAQKSGWRIHPISHVKTSWLFFKGLPLLEIHQRKILSDKPAKISKLQLPLEFKASSAFDFIARDTITYGEELRFIIDGKDLSFSQIAQ